jgi:predicted transport protein
MNIVDQAFDTQLKNIQAKTGKSLEQLYALIRASGLTRHAVIRDMLKRDLGLGHGDANTLARFYFKSSDEGSAQQSVSLDDVIREIYAGPKADLHSIHEALMNEIARFGPFEIAPKKGYISLRRKKQFAMIGPVTKTRLEVGLNMKGVEATPRLMAMPAGGMCQYKVNVTNSNEVDAELVGWIRQAYDSAG